MNSISHCGDSTDQVPETSKSLVGHLVNEILFELHADYLELLAEAHDFRAGYRTLDTITSHNSCFQGAGFANVAGQVMHLDFTLHEVGNAVAVSYRSVWNANVNIVHQWEINRGTHP